MLRRPALLALILGAGVLATGPAPGQAALEGSRSSLGLGTVILSPEADRLMNRTKPGPGLRDRKGTLRLPASGTVGRRFREPDGKGKPSQGIILCTRPGAEVIALLGAAIEFARPYEGWGQLLILATGDGYHFTLAGMTKIYGAEDQRVLEGESVGVMAEERMPAPGPWADGIPVSACAEDSPKLYFEIRENGEPIDPLPWLATDTLERTAP